ncbi:hypothetical protein D3C77_701550 [compost metagenome]
MALLERSDHRRNQCVGHHQLHPPLFDLLDHAGLPDEWLAAVQRAELTLAQHLPGAAIVVADASAASGEHSGLDLLHMAGRDEEGELVHP